jgi:hypothetical protein
LQCLRNRITTLIRGYAKGTSIATIRGSVMNQPPDRLRIVTFSQYLAVGVGQCDRNSHGAAIGHQNFPPSVKIKQIGPHAGRQFAAATFIDQAATVSG